MNEEDASRAHLAFFFVILLLTIDTINPVKIFLHVFPQVATWHVATISIIIMIYIFLSELKNLLYFSVKIFFHSILSIFFKQIEIVGRDNIPNGPVIFIGNHCNQFIDGLLIMCTCHRMISYLVAEKSWNRPVIGHLSWAMNCVPIQRAQDSAKRGSGKVDVIEKDESGNIVSIYGRDGTNFTTEVHPGDKIRVQSIAIKITSVDSDTAMIGAVASPEDWTKLFAQGKPSNQEYDILKHIDQSIVYTKVLDRLASSQTIGIFPEGGSHDRTDLLPLKVGVALIAYSSLEKHGINVPIVPVGLNYFRGHRFRGSAIIEYGSPVYIDLNTLPLYKQGGAVKRQVCSALLEQIADSMRGVLVTTPDYESLQVIYTARRLYQRKLTNSAGDKLDLTRRFAQGYKQLLLSVKGNPPPEWLNLQLRIVQYQKELNYLGIKDYQVHALVASEKYELEGDTFLREIRLPFLILRTFILFCLALLPAIGLNAPVGLIAKVYAEQRRKYALKNSKVKIHANDVILSEKVVLCIVLVPSLWIMYILYFIFCTDYDGPTIALCAFCIPFFAYLGIMATEAGMINLKDLRPYYMRLFPSTRRRLSVLPAVRKKLQSDLRKFVREIGPSMGELYYEKELNWREIQEKWRKNKESTLLEESSKGSDDAVKKTD